MTAALVLHRADGAPVSTPFRRAAFGKNDPFARQREIAWEGPGAMAAGRISFIGELEIHAPAGRQRAIREPRRQRAG